MKKLILVNPAWGGRAIGMIGRLFKFGHPPVFSVLEAMTPDYRIKVYNQPFFIHYEKALVGITAFASNVYRAYQYGDQFRKKGAKVIMGGPHVMFNIEEALNHCDCVIVGEVEAVWRDVLRDYENGSLKSVYYPEAKENFWEYYHDGFLKLQPGKLQNAVQTTRGCKFHCRFCMVPKLFPGIRHVPVEKVVEQVRASQRRRRRRILFNDNNIIADPVYARELFRALVPLKVKWEGLCSIDIACDESLLDLAKASGCYALSIGFETVNQEAIKMNSGKLDFYHNYLKLIKVIKKRKIFIRGTFLVGFDEDTYISLWRLFVFTCKANLGLAVFSVLTPFPGTQIFDELRRQKRIISYDWRKYNAFHVVVHPKHMNRFIFAFLFVFLRYSFLFTSTMGRIMLVFLLFAFI